MPEQDDASTGHVEDPNSLKEQLFNATNLIFRDLVEDDEIELVSQEELDAAETIISSATIDPDLAIELYDQIIAKESMLHKREVNLVLNDLNISQPNTVEEYMERILASGDEDLLNVPIKGANTEFAPFFVAHWVNDAQRNGKALDKSIVLNQLTRFYINSASRFYVASLDRLGKANEVYLGQIGQSYRARATLTRKLSDVM